MGGINVNQGGFNPPAGCDYAYYFENHPNGSVAGTWERYIPLGISNGVNDYHVRFTNSGIGSAGMYVIVDGLGYTVFNNQWCCSDGIDVGVEVADPGPGWSQQTVHDSPVAYYDLNWGVHNWSGCTANGFPNNCSFQDAGFTGGWDVPWNDYRNSYP
jgi:hypothetical protein